MPSKKICKICRDDIEVKENGEVFVACGVCGFPVCRPCYEYERSEGNQTCPQCHTRYKRLKGGSALTFIFTITYIVTDIVISKVVI